MSVFDSKSRVLIVDDDPGMTRLLTKFVETSFGEQVTCTSLTDSREALARINDGVVDILFPDLAMPDIDGLDLLRAAKERNALTQVILLTGQTGHESLICALEGGAANYLVKPIRKEDVAEVLGQTINRQSRWKEALAQIWRTRRATAAVETSTSASPSHQGS